MRKAVALRTSDWWTTTIESISEVENLIFFALHPHHYILQMLLLARHVVSRRDLYNWSSAFRIRRLSMSSVNWHNPLAYCGSSHSLTRSIDLHFKRVSMATFIRSGNSWRTATKAGQTSCQDKDLFKCWTFSRRIIQLRTQALEWSLGNLAGSWLTWLFRLCAALPSGYRAIAVLLPIWLAWSNAPSCIVLGN